MNPELATSLDSVAHVIQTALTPVFLLSGIAALLNVFAGRLARVSDRSRLVTSAIATAAGDERELLERQVRYLHRRSVLLDVAVLLGTAAGASTCIAALLLFVGSLRDATIGGLLYLSFGLALVSTAGALVAFMVEVLMASRGMRARQTADARRAARKDRDAPTVRG